MKTLYLDCASGISGDMTLGALVDAGVDLKSIQKGVESLGLPDVRIELTEVKRHAFRAAKINVLHPPEHAHRHLHHIVDMIRQSQLTEGQQDLACQIFTKLGEAEAKVHGSTLEKVHFHEVGAIDSIADIVGVAIGLELLGAEQIVCSAVPTGHGTIQIAHGRCSVPAPATAELLTGIPLAESVVASELTTPTGAAIVATVADRFGPLPAMTIERIGYGAGDKDFEEQANVLRLVVGESTPTATRSAHHHGHHHDHDQVTVVETNLDDVTGEVVGHVTEKLFAAGALDVYLTPIQMKKNRPASKLTILCRSENLVELESIVFRETRTLGIRRWNADRTKLAREAASVETPWGPVSGKSVVLAGSESVFLPEFEDCRQLAEEHGVPVRRVLQVAQDATP